MFKLLLIANRSFPKGLCDAASNPQAPGAERVVKFKVQQANQLGSPFGRSDREVLPSLNRHAPFSGWKIPIRLPPEGLSGMPHERQALGLWYGAKPVHDFDARRQTEFR